METKTDICCSLKHDSCGNEHKHHHHHHEYGGNECGCTEESGCGCGHEHHHHAQGLKAFVWPAVSFVMLVCGILMSNFGCEWFTGNRWIEFGWYVLAFLPVGLPVMKEAAEGVAHGDFFNEFTLMVIASIGAFCIWELPEAVGVMLFYSVGETLQHGAVERARGNISRLLDMRGEVAHLVTDHGIENVDPSVVKIGSVIEIKPGERVPLDGELNSDYGIFDTSALTGESVPREIEKGKEVLAGMISVEKSVRIKVNREYSQSALSRILQMVEQANSRKASAELFIRKFARLYTPIVIALAALVVAVPAVIGLLVPSFHFVFSEWLYRALVFLVISCPCALVISVPLGYYAGIGAASKAGILVKGGNYLDVIARLKVVAFDKTGTLTTGKFSVEKMSADDFTLSLMAAAEAGSNHPLARALVKYVKDLQLPLASVEQMKEIAGRGVEAVISGKRVLAGNLKLLEEASVKYPEELVGSGSTVIVAAVDGKYAGCVTLADTLKEDAHSAIDSLRKEGVEKIVILSGDRSEIAEKTGIKLGVDQSIGELLPEGKANYVEKAVADSSDAMAFVGDGINDAPVLALSNVGIAMGGLGSDAAIESADVVIQTDKPSRVATAIKIGRTTGKIVKENIVFAIGIKVLILVLGVCGYASLWAAVFADVGVALLAVLNSMRIMWKKYD